MRSGHPRWSVPRRKTGSVPRRIGRVAWIPVLALAIGTPGVGGQQETPASLACNDEARPLAAAQVTLEDFAWLAGSWRGEGPGGAAAEVHYMAPVAGVLPSVFRLRTEERTVVLEAITLVEEDEELMLYVRHFTSALEPLEEENALELRLTERRGDCFLFENVREENPRRSLLRRTGPEGFLSRSELRRADGSGDEIRVEYTRVR